VRKKAIAVGFGVVVGGRWVIAGIVESSERIEDSGRW